VRKGPAAAAQEARADIGWHWRSVACATCSSCTCARCVCACTCVRVYALCSLLDAALCVSPGQARGSAQVLPASLPAAEPDPHWALLRILRLIGRAASVRGGLHAHMRLRRLSASIRSCVAHTP